MTISDSHVLTISDSHVLTISDSHVLTISDSHVLTISDSHVLTISDSHVLTISDVILSEFLKCSKLVLTVITNSFILNSLSTYFLETRTTNSLTTCFNQTMPYT